MTTSDYSLSPEAVTAFLRSNSTGTLQFDDLVEPVKYVIDREGHPVTAGSRAMKQAADSVLFVPDEVDGSLELMITMEDQNPESAEADRWRIYHGQPDRAVFIRLYLEAAKYHSEVFDGDAIAARA